MKTRCSITIGLLVIIMIAGAVNVVADNRILHTEFSIAGSMQAAISYCGASYLANVPVRIGAFVARNIEIEAEAIATIGEGYYSDTEVGYIASLNGSFYFTTAEKALPFVLIGYGFANSIPTGNVCADKIYDDVTFNVLNAGLGMKCLFTYHAGMRIEYRMQRFSGNKDYSYSNYYGDYQSYRRELKFTLQSVFVGVSLFF